MSRVNPPGKSARYVCRNYLPNQDQMCSPQLEIGLGIKLRFICLLFLLGVGPGWMLVFYYKRA
ncbi:MAG: hypothetical protein WBF08_01020 [Candidatus Bathyarchaeia archaeon]